MLIFYMPGTCAMAEIILCERLQTPYWLCRVERDERKQDPYLSRVNPHGQVPAMITDKGKVLTENAALLLRISDHHAQAGLGAPAGSEDRDVIHYWLSYLDSGYHMAYAPLFKTQAFAEDEAAHPSVKAAALKRVSQSLTYLQKHLQGRKHFALGRETLLDGYFYAMGRWARKFFELKKEFPAVEEFLVRCEAEAWVQTAMKIEAGEITEGKSLRGHKSLNDAISLIVSHG